jgi:beta-lactamase regulating signal transducer with metallopeptidase domain
MNVLGMQSVAQLSVERVLNSLPEGLLLALFAWLLLRLIGRQNSGTRFAVWFVTLMAVAGLSLFGGFQLLDHGILPATTHFSSHITIPVFWAEVLFAAWIFLACAALARVAVGLWQVWAIRRSCTLIDLSQLDSATVQILEQHSAARSVRLAVSERVKVPAAFGFWKSMIVLPTWTLRELTPADLNPILIHELTHLKRRDDWTNLLQKVVRAVFFFHPAVWWIDSRLSLEREMACDDAVLANTGNPHAYASSLISILEKSCARRGWTMAQAAVRRARDLSLRITQILDAKRPTTTHIWKPALALTSIFSLACFGLSSCMPRMVSFAPQTTDAAARMARIKAVLHAEDTDMPDMHAAVVPASYHVPSPVQHAQHQAVKQHNATPAAPRLVSQPEEHQRTIPQVVKTKAAAPKHIAPAPQMVVFIETSYFDYAGNSQNPQQTNMRVLQILFIAPVQNAQQMEVGASSI